MTYEEINQMIEKIGLPSTYYQWPEKEAPDLPYIVFYYPERNDFYADGKNYKKITVLNIELYSDNKDFDNEELIENMLEENDLPYTKEEQYISEERMYEVFMLLMFRYNGGN